MNQEIQSILSTRSGNTNTAVCYYTYGTTYEFHARCRCGAGLADGECQEWKNLPTLYRCLECGQEWDRPETIRLVTPIEMICFDLDDDTRFKRALEALRSTKLERANRESQKADADAGKVALELVRIVGVAGELLKQIGSLQVRPVESGQLLSSGVNDEPRH